MARNMEQAQASAGPHGPSSGASQQLGDCTGPGLEHRYGGSTQ